MSAQPGRTAGPAKTHLRSLTGMRFFAAAGVFLFHGGAAVHVFASGTAHQTYGAAFGQAGWSAVSFFFVLSGFVLTWSARPNDTKGAFWLRRVAKVWPNHVVTFVAAALLITLVAGRTLNAADAVPNLFLVHSWIPRPSAAMSVNTVSWSLACEALFYLCFPLLLPLIRRIRPERLWAWALGVVGLTFLIALAAYALPAEPAWPVATGSLWRNWFVYLLPVSRLPEFVLGILLARIVLTGRKLPLGFGGSVALTVVAYAVASLFPGATVTMVAVTVLPLGLVIAAGAAAESEGRPTLLSGRTMVWLGEVSFAFYMCHLLVLRYGLLWLAPGTHPTPVALGLLTLAFVGTTALAWLMFVLVERPITRRVSSHLRRRAARTAGDGPARAGATDPSPAAP
ncbi:peptidoglycan/LPS O-acetylase OafA/YrhL [Saccharothrix carnea]|uniref:Peptidoglycan/LPS O-acetylase OafA/YrhL n=1 Tax=Saccharothrix carnea TaxID=1280637 RepID=A0A2P8I0L7_SACCR|nr:acyltransferase [Saccharothrix carnea]PSL51983.1 peptidoglycan/LPS O-acetylase OafA/YrhL [Saccharothrix carnea]